MKKYPLYYYLILLIAFIFSAIFWIFVFSKSINSIESNHSSIDESIYILKPIDKDKIINDEESKRKIVSDIVNVAIKDTTNVSASFIKDFKEKFNQEYQIYYADSTINFFQIKLPEEKRISFKEDVKKALPSYDLLVWDESIFSNKEITSSNKDSWYLDASNLRNVTASNNSQNVILAIIDNGFDVSHPSFAGRIIKPFNVTNDSQNVSPANMNHGSHVASIAAGNRVDNSSLQGICTSCKIMPIKIEDNNGIMSSTYIIKGILYAIKNHADVINMSFGTEIVTNEPIPIEIQQQFIRNGAKDEESFWVELFNYAEKNKTICVLAAGNSNMLTGFDPFQRAKNTIKVGAVDEELKKADFSNYGSFTTIYAPGTQILGAKPNNQYEYLDGTSMASPIVSGFIALLKSQHKNADFSQIFALLNKNTTQINNLNILKYNNLN